MSSERGASAIDRVVPLCVPEIRGNEWHYVKEALDTNWVSSAGPFVERFERDLAAYVGALHGVATVNGTAALHTALMVAGVEPDDEVVVPALTFVAPVNAVRYVGAWPVFIDVEPTYGQMDPDKTVDFLRRSCDWKDGALMNRHTGRRVRAMIPVHILGHPVDMAPLIEAAQTFNLTVIEDATESLGARYRGQRVGTLGDIACFSFNGNKLLTTGGGGMLVTDNKAWAARARYLTTQAKDDPVEYVHHEVGYNYRLTNVQAAIGCAQLEQVGDFIRAKREIADIYTTHLETVPGITPMRQAPWAESIFWLYTVLIDEEKFGMNRRELMNKLAGRSIQTRPLWHPVHRLRPFQSAYAHRVEIADRMHSTALSLPSSVGLANHPDDLQFVLDAVEAQARATAV